MLRTFLFILLSCAFTAAVANDQRTQTKQEIAKAAQDIAELKKQLNKIQQEKSTAEQALKKPKPKLASWKSKSEN